jgi:hypothetical protein
MSELTTVEIAGVKYEVKIDQATRIESFKVGDTVKVLEKEYGDTFKSKYGVILGFDDFKDFPNIQVATLDLSYNTASIKILDINSSTEKDNKYRISKVMDANLLIDKAEVLRIMDMEIEKKKAEGEELQRKKNYFNERFNVYFEGKK